MRLHANLVRARSGPWLIWVRWFALPKASPRNMATSSRPPGCAAFTTDAPARPPSRISASRVIHSGAKADRVSPLHATTMVPAALSVWIALWRCVGGDLRRAGQFGNASLAALLTLLLRTGQVGFELGPISVGRRGRGDAAELHGTVSVIGVPVESKRRRVPPGYDPWFPERSTGKRGTPTQKRQRRPRRPRPGCRTSSRSRQPLGESIPL
jgi:hypothetical protein